jgi:hypothetical protein
MFVAFGYAAGHLDATFRSKDIGDERGSVVGLHAFYLEFLHGESNLSKLPVCSI